MVDIVQIVFMIPISLRERLCIEPGTTLEYEEFESGGRKRVRINLIQKKTPSIPRYLSGFSKWPNHDSKTCNCLSRHSK